MPPPPPPLAQGKRYGDIGLDTVEDTVSCALNVGLSVCVCVWLR